MTNFRIPWRLLIPPGSVDSVIGTDSGLGLSQKSGAKVSVSTPEEAPQTLSDKIVKVEGTVGEQEAALAQIVAQLFEFQGTLEDEDGLCVLVMPSCAVGAVIGAKGSKISEIMSESGAEIDVGRECIIGMPDNPVVLRGRPPQIVRAAVLCNGVLQDLADKQRIQPEDFCYVPGRTSTRPPFRPGPGPSSQGACARFVVDKDFAGFLIGKGGEKIKRLRDQTGATLQFRGPAEEVTLILGPDQRVLDIRGSAEERNEATRACFVEMDAASITTTRLLLPLAVPQVPLEEACIGTGASLELQDDIVSPESTERLVRLSGDSGVRLAAVLALLAKADGYAGSQTKGNQGNLGNQAQGAQEVAQPPAATPTEIKEPTMPIQSPPGDTEERKLEPESGKIFTFQEFRVAFGKEYSEKDIVDYWRDACQPVPENGHQSKEAVQEAKPLQAVHKTTDLAREPEQRASLEHRASPERASPEHRASPERASPVPPKEELMSLRPDGSKKGLGALFADSQPSELHVVLPSKVVKGPLVAHGHLADIAVGCGVEVHVCSEVSPGKLQVTLKGSCPAIAMASLALQMRICFAG